MSKPLWGGPHTQYSLQETKPWVLKRMCWREGTLQTHTQTGPMSKYREEMVGKDIEYWSLAIIGAHTHAHTDRQIGNIPTICNRLLQ